MAVKLEDWISRVSTRDIPVFKTTVSAISHITSKHNSSAGELANAILRDPSLTAKILKFANSPFFNTSGNSINTVSRAVVLLGFDSIRELTRCLAVTDSIPHPQKKERIAEIAVNSLHSAVQARSIAEKLGLNRLEEIFIATLLYDIGEMAFWSFSTKKEMDILLNAEKENVLPSFQVHRQVFGFQFMDLTISIIEGWGLSNILGRTLRGECQGDPHSQAVRLGKELASALPQGWESDAVRSAVRRIVVFLDIAIDEVDFLLKTNAREATLISRDYGAKNRNKLIPEISEKNLGREKDQQKELFDYPVFDPALQMEILQELSNVLKTSPDSDLVMKMLLDAVHRGIGMDRAVFAHYVPLRAQIRSKYVWGIDAADLLDSFIFPVDHALDNPFFETLFGAGKGLWIDNTNSSGYSDAVMEKIRNILKSQAFFIAPIIVQNRPLGLIYADRQPSKRPLDYKSFKSFEHISEQARMAVEYLSMIKKKKRKNGK